MSKAAWLAWGILSAATVAQAFDYAGTKSVVAVSQDGRATRIGTVDFTPDTRTAGEPGAIRFRLTMDHAVLQDFFLSMREFKCLPAAVEILCHVPYPYPNPGTIRPGQPAWLEHHLLFLFKQPTDFGAKLWNGVIFRLDETPGALVGRPQAVDLNQISAPPASSAEPPYTAADRTDFPDRARWIRELRIE